MSTPAKNKSAQSDPHRGQVGSLNRSIRLLETVVIVLIITVLAFSGVLVYYFQSVASLSGVTLDKVVETQNSIIDSSLKTYSSNYGFQVTYNTDRWFEDTHDRSLLSAETLLLTYKDSKDVGAVFSIQADIIDSFFKSNFDKQKSEKDDLDKATAYLLENQYLSKKLDKVTKKERIKRWGFDVNHITVKSTYRIGLTSESYIDFFLANGNFYVVKYGYPTLLSSNNSLVDGVLDSITFTKSQAKDNVKGALTENSANLNALTIAQSVEVTKPSIVNIWHSVCNKITIHNDGSLFYLKPEYTFCGAYTGSGFIVNSQGYVATNGHVVKSYPEIDLVEAVLGGIVTDLLSDYVREINFQINQTDMSQIDADNLVATISTDSGLANTILGSMYNLMDQRFMELSHIDSRYFVKLGNSPFTLNEDKIMAGDILNAVSTATDVYSAELVDFNFGNFMSVETILRKAPVHGSDVALLKLEGSQTTFPAVHIGDSLKLKEGEDIIVVGYPGVAVNNGLVNYESSAKPTISRGVVSAIKQDNDGLTLIQTDASIEHGNSGGPALDSSGDVIGIATYGVSSQSGNYNFLRSTQDLLDLMKKNSIDNVEGDIYADWRLGLKDFWQQHYRTSIKSFDIVKQKYPIHATVDSFITDANEGIANGEDKSSLFASFSLSNPSSVVIIVAVGGGLVIVVVTLVLILVLRKKRNAQTQVSNSVPVPTIVNIPNNPPPVQ